MSSNPLLQDAQEAWDRGQSRSAFQRVAGGMNTGNVASAIGMVAATQLLVWSAASLFAVTDGTAALVGVVSTALWALFIVRGRVLRGWPVRLPPESIRDVLAMAIFMLAFEVAAAVILKLPAAHLAGRILAAALTPAVLIVAVVRWRMRLDMANARVVIVGPRDARRHVRSVLDRCGEVVAAAQVETLDLPEDAPLTELREHLRQGKTVLVLDERQRRRFGALRMRGDLVFASESVLLRYLFEKKRSSRWTKSRDALDRTVHRLTALMIFLVLLPVSAVTALFIVKEDGRPVVFSQYRTGRRGKPYTMYKFRSMLRNLPKQGFPPTDENDPRVTRVGRVLRRYGLDEIPQLWNVIRGDMRLVGPRPDQPFICFDYTPLERRRLEIAPGLTGFWQLSPHRNEPIHHHVEYDYCYLHSRGLLLDAAICLATPVASILSGKR